MKVFFPLLTGSLVLLIGFTSHAQTSDKILADLSAKAKKYSSIYAEYSSQLLDKANGVDIKQKGKVFVKGEKYNVELGDYTMISDGASVWTYDKSSNDCSIDYLEDVADGAMSPSKMFTIWEDGFKHEFKSEVKENGRTLYWINLYPVKPSDKNFHTIQLYIDKDKMEVAKFVVKGREGNDVIYTIVSFQANKEITEENFRFNAKKFPGVRVTDNRI